MGIAIKSTCQFVYWCEVMLKTFERVQIDVGGLAYCQICSFLSTVSEHNCQSFVILAIGIQNKGPNSIVNTIYSSAL